MLNFQDCISSLQDLLIRVEEAVDEYLYWDEELTIIESVNSVSGHQSYMESWEAGEVSHVN